MPIVGEIIDVPNFNVNTLLMGSISQNPKCKKISAVRPRAARTLVSVGDIP